MTLHNLPFLNHNNNQHGPLSKTAKIILIACVSAAVLLIICAIAFYFYRRRQTARRGTILRETGKGDLEFENDEELRPMVLQTQGRGLSEGTHGEGDVGLGVVGKGKGSAGMYFPGQGEDMYAGGGYGQVGQRGEVPYGKGPITMEEGDRGTEFYRNQ
jgi:hypothetical protein